MKIIIDADACPVLKIAIEIALKNDLDILIVADTSHHFSFDNPKITHIIVDKGFDSADFFIVNKTCENDIVITQDYALASMCLAKKGNVINQNGMIYSDNNIDELMFRRHLGKQLRSLGKREAKIKKRTFASNQNFATSFKQLIDQNKL